ncbi:MAG: type II toxin-antitoxin system RelE/ParE family toxin [Propionibacteriaceae bacterium]|jgi:mRNA interferase RelE/StbE|nr:type II toxin-antitoxin system RelE/ParE family toxin [Propionibacteriaceae bacterium]
MSKWRARFKPSARQDLRALPRHTALRLLSRLTDLEADPYSLGTTELMGAAGYRRLRGGSYRVVYTLDHGELIVWVVSVGHRSTTYRDQTERY